MTTKIRPAEPADVPALFHIRTSVRENHLSREQLAGLGITETSIAEMISSAPCAWVAVSGDEVVGFSMIDITEGSLFAAFVLPSHEGMGFGAELVRVAENGLFRHHSEIWLETAENSRAAGFYKHLGWGNEVKVEDDQIRLTKARH
ncbi:GNAT family N-acetyltransferase [Agrobacterium larrymoorei]|uniref:Ribosomal protein S18 acetylase RimI-like enzyme n=1 Tax=Agrobacterium larrymoorei TaxID=160699 RepID=A0ABU0UQ66_9HYPH|nr:GNAT family N-acetyltransferase [Agrobacterium larrymoorei]MDQ1187095.1 ribosomal protein S18 acetylase RimI-like enzyme [Agrobacterium larrymoorei]